MHIVEFLDEFLLTPDIEIVEARLPELGQAIMHMAERKWELLAGRFFARIAAEPPRHTLLQHLHDGRGRTFRRLADEQVDVVGHDDVAHQCKAVAVAHFAQNLHKQILRARGGKQGQSSVTAARNEMEVAQSIPAPQSLGHEPSHQKPRPRRGEDGAPKVQNLNSEWTYGSSIRVWSQDDSVEGKRPGHPAIPEGEALKVIILNR